jgi:uncharacterized protein (TIGR03067 family)
MRAFASVSVVVFLIFSAAQAGDDALMKKELEALRGNWNAKEADDGLRIQWSMVEDSLQIRMGGASIDAKFRINPAKNPKEIDIITRMADGSDRVIPGIYKLSADTLDVRIDPSGKKRPTEFKAKDSYAMKREQKKDK